MKKTREIPVFYKIKAVSEFYKGIEGYEEFDKGDYMYGAIILEYPNDTKDLTFYMDKIVPLAVVKDEKYLKDITLISEKEFILWKDIYKKRNRWNEKNCKNNRELERLNGCSNPSRRTY